MCSIVRNFREKKKGGRGGGSYFSHKKGGTDKIGGCFTRGGITYCHTN